MPNKDLQHNTKDSLATKKQNLAQEATPKTKKQRNFWPYGILLVILLGVVLISVSIRISVKNPVVDDVPFFIKHNDMDLVINDLLESSKALQNKFDFFIEANVVPANSDDLRPYSPYMRPPHRDKSTQRTSAILHTKTLNTLFLRVSSKNPNLKPNNLHFQAFIQKIGNINDQEIFIYNPQDNSYASAKPSKKGAQIPIGKLIKQDKPQQSKQDFIYASPFFMLELEGRWIVSLQINYDDKNNDEKPTTVVLEKEFFALPNPAQDQDNNQQQSK